MRRRAAIVATALAAVLVPAALGFFPQEPLRRFVEARLRSALGPEARIGRLHVVPLALRAEVAELSLRGPSYSVDVPRARVSMALASVFGAPLSLESVEIEEPRIALRAGPGAATAPAGASLAPLLPVRNLSVTGASLEYDDPGLGGPVRLRGIDFRGGLGTGALHVAVAGGVWERPRPVTLGPATARVRLSPGLELHLDDLEAGTTASRIHATGALGRVGAFAPDLKVAGRLDLAEMAILSGATGTRGTVSGEGRVSASQGRLRAEAGLAGQGLVLSGWPVDRWTARLVRDEDGAAVSTRLDLLGGRVQGEARLRASTLDADLRISDIDLARLRRQGPMDAAPLHGTLSGSFTWKGDVTKSLASHGTLTATGRVSDVAFLAQAEASGSLQPRERTLDLAWTAALQAERSGDERTLPRLEAGRLVIKGTATGPLPPALDGTIQGRLAIGSDAGTLDVAVRGTMSAQGREASASIVASGLGGSVTASLESRGAELGRLSLRGDSLGLEPLLNGIRGRLGFTIEASGQGRDLSGRVWVDGLGWGDLGIGAVTAEVEATQGQGEITVEAPALHLTGRAHVRSGAKPDLQGTVTLTAMPLAWLSPLMPGSPLDGRASGTLDVEVPLSHPGAARFRGRLDELELATRGLSLRAVRPFGLTAQAGRVTLEGLRAEGPGLVLEASGAFSGAAAAPLEARVVAHLDLAELPQPAGASLRGSVGADLRLSGTMQRPLATGHVTARDVVAEGRSLPRVTVDEGRFDLQGSLVSIPGIRALVAGGWVSIAGRLPLASLLGETRGRTEGLSRDEQADLAIEWQGIPASAILERLGAGRTDAIEATLAGRARLEGGFASLAEARGEVTLPVTDVLIQDLRLRLSPFSVRLRGGRVLTDGITLEGDAGALRIAGGIDLGGRTLDLAGRGLLELRALSPFLAEASASGTAELDVSLTGSIDAPSARGTAVVRNGTVRLRALPQALTGLGAKLVFDDTTARIEEASGVLGGGTLTISGIAAIEGARLSDVRIDLRGRDMAIRHPEGLRSRLDADLSLTGRPGALLLSGSIQVLRGLYDLDIAFEENLWAAAPKPVESPFLRSVGLDVRVETRSPVLVRNNLAQLQAAGNLTVRGDMQTPAPIGAFDVQPGGKVFLQGRSFVINSGRLIYRATWDPEIALEAEAPIQAQNDLTRYRVRVGIKGTLERPEPALRSEPTLSEAQIVSLLATGRTNSNDPALRNVLGGEAAALLAGRLARGLRGLGFDEVSLQPELLAREGEAQTGARFTFGKQLATRVHLVYSLSLQNPEARFLQMEISPARELTLSVKRTDEGAVTYGAGQRFRRGGPARRPQDAPDERVRLRAIRLEGDRPFGQGSLRDLLRVRPGSKVSIWDLQEAADDLREGLIARGYLEAEVGTQLEEDTAVFRIGSGARYQWRVEGMARAPDLGDEVRRSLFGEEALDRGRARLLEELHRRGHLRAAVTARSVSEGGGMTLLFAAEPGPVVRLIGVRFPGAMALSRSDLMRAGGGAGRILVEPGEAVRGILGLYRERHHLAAEVDSPRVVEGPGGRSVRIEIAVREGPRARVAAIRFEGSTRRADELARLADIEPGSFYEEGRVAAALERLQAHYLGLGYPGIRLKPSVLPVGSNLDLVVEVVEGERAHVGSVVVTGLSRTRESVVRRQVALEPGDPLDPRKLSAIERRLLDLGLFSRVAVSASPGNPATVTVAVVEGDRLIAGYLLGYSQEDRGTAQLDAEARNLLGAGLSAGGRFRFGKDVGEVSGFLKLPSLGRAGNLTASAFRVDEDLHAGGDTRVRNNRVLAGFQLQQTLRLGDRWDLLSEYRFKRSILTSPFFTEPFTDDVASLDASLIRDTRDSVLDARRGRFLSLSLEYSPAFLGSDFTFVKGFAQAFTARSMGRALTWAQSYRLGLAYGFGGQRLVSFERFRAGGANSLRGFATDAVGPRSRGQPAGGEAAVVLNQELRYHHHSGLGAAVFFDAGNVFRSAGEITLELRHSLGAGLRYASPVGLLRLDVGFPLGREPGEPSHRVFVSLGQAF